MTKPRNQTTRAQRWNEIYQRVLKMTGCELQAKREANRRMIKEIV